MTPRARRRTRLAAAAAACLLLGAVTSILVAWACVLWGPATRSIADTRVHGAVEWLRPAPSSWPAVPLQGQAWRTWVLSSDYVYSAPAYGNLFGMQEVEFGAPLRCAVTGLDWRLQKDGSTTVSCSGIEAPPGLARRARSQHPWRLHLPTSILWPGFLANTLLYGGLVWCLAFGPGWILRRVRYHRGSRRRRNLCPACGYSRAGLAEGAACPECGRARP